MGMRSSAVRSYRSLSHCATGLGFYCVFFLFDQHHTSISTDNLIAHKYRACTLLVLVYVPSGGEQISYASGISASVMLVISVFTTL